MTLKDRLASTLNGGSSGQPLNIPGNDFGFDWVAKNDFGQSRLAYDPEGCARYRGQEAFVGYFTGCQLIAARIAAGMASPQCDGANTSENLAMSSRDHAARKAVLIGHRTAVGEFVIRSGMCPFVSADEFLAFLQSGGA